MPGGGAGEERSGAAEQTTRSGGGQQRSAQRTQGLSVRGHGLRPGGEERTTWDCLHVDLVFGSRKLKTFYQELRLYVDDSHNLGCR